MIRKGFASDNNAGVHPFIMEEMKKVNQGHVIAYGDDPYTEKAIALCKEHFGEDADIYFVLTGTGANVLGLKALTKSYHSIMCAETAHIHVDECGAPEKYTGCKLLTIETADGKLTTDLIQKHMHGFGFEHHSQPKVISLTQSTEMGTVYTIDEIRKITGFAHQKGLVVHMDGARLCNAAARLGVGLIEMTRHAGIDVLSFGGTKNGMMYGEAIVFFKPGSSADFKYIRKQGMQLISKMRFIAAQFIAFFSTDIWLTNAQHANKMAQLLYTKMKDLPHVTITQKVEANGVFAILPKSIIPALQKEFFFYVWNEDTGEVRWMTSFDTTEEDVEKFYRAVKKHSSG